VEDSPSTSATGRHESREVCESGTCLLIRMPRHVRVCGERHKVLSDVGIRILILICGLGLARASGGGGLGLGMRLASEGRDFGGRDANLAPALFCSPALLGLRAIGLSPLPSTRSWADRFIVLVHSTKPMCLGADS
jgi:hypothetical protein